MMLGEVMPTGRANMGYTTFERGVRAGARVMYGSWTSGSAVLFVTPAQDRIVLVEKRGERWALPSGFRRRGESPEVAAQREAWEETGLQVDLLDEHQIALIDRSDPHVHFLFKVTVNEQPLVAPRARRWWSRVLQGADSRNPRWIPIADLKSISLTPQTVAQLGAFGLLPLRGREVGRSELLQVGGAPTG
jgi:ADP-ribose pyrophosphatase YjhB (NUDIX family)